MKEITPIELGDIVYCGDFDKDHAETCWVNGQMVLEIFEQFPGRKYSIFSTRARFAMFDGASHSTFYLRHKGERCRTSEDIDEAMRMIYGDMTK